MEISAALIILNVIPIMYLIFQIVIKNKSTKLFSFFISTLLEAIMLLIIFNIHFGVWEIVLSVAINILIYIIDLNIIIKSKLEFGNYQIISFWLIYNKLKNAAESNDKTKNLGIVIPYSKATIKYGGRIIKYPEINSKGGTMVTGATGSGKSVQAMELIKQDIEYGRNVVFFDFKGEKSTADTVKDFARQNGYEIYSLDEEDGFSFDPLFDMSPTGRVEAILNTRKWSMDGADAHFRTNTQLLIQKYITAFDKVFFNTNSKLYTLNFYKFVKANKPDLSNRAVADAYKTLETLLEVILTSKLGPSLSGKYERKFSFVESEKFNEKFVMVISIPSDSKEFASSISSFYFRNIMATGTKSSFSPSLALYIDEFGTLENPFVVKDILEKGRSCGIMTTIIMQDIFQVVINTNEAYLNSLLGTVNNFIIFSGATKEAAVKMAGVQIKEVEGILQTLMKPIDGHSPTACFITKIPVLDKKKASEVFKYVPLVSQSKIKINSIFSHGDGSGDPAERSNDTEETNDYDNGYFDNYSEDSNEDDFFERRAKKRKKDDDDFNKFLDDMGF